MSRLAAFLIFMCAIAGAKAQTARPPAGTDVDVSRQIHLLGSAPTPCVSIAKGEATVLLSRPALQRLANAKPNPESSESARLAFIQGARARALLALLPDTQDARHCVSPQQELTAEADYLLVDLLEHGNAFVLVTSTGTAVPEITVRYFGQRCGTLCGHGEITFSVPGNPNPFLSSSWWVS